jgi:hypothetical protein
MSNKPIQDSQTHSQDEMLFERLLRLVASLQASSPDTAPEEETLILQSSGVSSPMVLKMDSLRREIELRAYEIYLERGGTHGCDLSDWLQAEMELREKLGLTREKAVMRLALAWGLPKTPPHAMSAQG